MKAVTTSSHSQLIRGIGLDADRVYGATVGQRSHILQQLEEAERNARDALFALEMMELELARETAAMRSTLSQLSETLPAREFEKMCDFAFDQSKQDWENVWKREWVADGTERDRFVKHPSGPSKKPRSNPRPSPPAPNAPSSPLPPSSPPAPTPTPPVNPRDRLPPRTSPVRINGIPWDEFKWPTRPRSPPTLDGFRTPSGFVENFGSTSYRPTQPEPVAPPSHPQRSRRLRRDKRRVEIRPDGSLVVVDPAEEIEAQRQQIRGGMLLQAQRRIPTEAGTSLMRLLQTGVHDRVHDPPVTWFRLFEGDSPTPNDLTNPFAQDDHIPPTYQEMYPRRPGQGEQGEQEPESEANHHVQDHQQ